MSDGQSDFARRCATAGVVKCVGFDSAATIALRRDGRSGTTSGATAPELDWSLKASGSASLRFTIPPNSGPNTSGNYFTNFSDDLSMRFGENSEFYVQWRQRFSPELLAGHYVGGGGWKLAIIGTGDRIGIRYGSCSALEVVVTSYYEARFPVMYNSCTGSASHGPYDGLHEAIDGGKDFRLQNARPAPHCLYSQTRSSPFPPTGNCFGYAPDEWMTFQVAIATGPRVGDEFVDSRIRLWIARENRPSELVIDRRAYNLTAGDPAEDQRFGKVWLLPYNTGKSPAQRHPVAYVWYDELIVSRSRIPDPEGPANSTAATSPIALRP